MEDYYAILGLDPGASQESIKLAYRRLARESHPDRYVNSTDAQKSVLSLQMAQLNGAYAVLSDATRKREYDSQLKILGTLSVNNISPVTRTATLTKTVTVPEAATKSNTGQRPRPSNDTDITLVQEFSKQLRTNLLTNRKGFSWKETALEGFDWGLESVSWATHYCVAGRAFAILDPAAAKKFVNYSEVVVSRFNRQFRRSHFLFLLPFQHVGEWESVSAEFNRFMSSEDRETRVDIPAAFLLFDARRGRTLQAGGQVFQKHFEELLQCLGPELLKSR